MESEIVEIVKESHVSEKRGLPIRSEETGLAIWPTMRAFEGL
jgi:hypothetical protein